MAEKRKKIKPEILNSYFMNFKKINILTFLYEFSTVFLNNKEKIKIL